MAFTFINPPYSFVQFTNAAIEPFRLDPLPVFDVADLQFQVFITFDTPDECADAMDQPDIDFKLLLLKGTALADDADLDLNTIKDYAANAMFFRRERIADNIMMLCWESDLVDFDTLTHCDKCFRLGLNIAVGGETFKKAGNYFTHTCNDKYTTLVEYYGLEDDYGFKYCQFDFTNKVRLPILLDQPQLPDDENIYFLSDGDARITRSLTRKEFEGSSEHLFFKTHEKIKIALSHDQVQVVCEEHTGGIRKNGNYEIKWAKENKRYKKAPAEFKAYATPYLVRNDNCEDCETYLPPVCDPPTFTDPGTQEANTGTPFLLEILLGGTAPFVLENIVKPDWMDIELDGSTITLSGTPTADASDVPVQFDITNCGGDNSVAFSSTISSITIEGPDIAFLTFTSYHAGLFLFTLSDAIPGAAIVIDAASVVGSTGEECTGFEQEDNIIAGTNPLTIAAGDTTGSVAGNVTLSTAVSYKRVNSIHIAGKGTFVHGNHVTIAGTNVTVQISTACTVYIT